MSLTLPGLQRTIALLDEGREHLNAGRRPAAERCFKAAARVCTIPAARNNWALCRYLDGDWKEALRILAPLLSCPDPAPFSRSLAALAHRYRGDVAAARELLQAAIRDFDRGLADPSLRGQVPEAAWNEYTLQIKQAAGALGDHAMVLELHRRWPGQDYALGAFMAGVAAFNLGEFAEAGRYWWGISDEGWRPMAEAYVRVTALAQEGLVPPFPLEYEADVPDVSKLQGEAAERALAESGALRMRSLDFLFDSGNADAAQIIAVLVGYTGEWGMDLGRRLLAGAGVSMSMKMAAAQALTELGFFAPGEEIPIVHEGHPTRILLRSRRC